MTSPRRRAALVVACAVPAIGVGELALHLHFARKPPTDADYRAAAPRVAALRAEADAVLVAPWWAEPHARRTFGEATLPLRDVARADERTLSRVVEISVVGERLPELAGFRALREEPLARSITARLLENPSPLAPRADLVDEVEATRVEAYVVDDQGEHPCPFRSGLPVVAPGLFGHPALPSTRATCGPGALQTVAVTVQDDLRFRARRCVLSPPPAAGHVELRFRDVPLGRVLLGHLSAHATHEREATPATITFEVLVDGEPLGRVVHREGDGWRPFELPLGPREGSIARDLRVRLSTQTPDRRSCWSLVSAG